MEQDIIYIIFAMPFLIITYVSWLIYKYKKPKRIYGIQNTNYKKQYMMKLGEQYIQLERWK